MLHLFSEIPPLLFSQPSYQFCNVTWPLLPSSSISLSLLIVVSFLFSCVAAYHASSFSLLLSVFSLFISCLWPPPVHVLLFPQIICSLDQLLPYPPTSFNSSCACGWLLYKIFFIVCCLFSTSWFIGMVVCFQQPRTNSPPPLYVHLLLGSMGFAHWLSGQSGGLAVQYFSNSKQFFSSSRGSI